MFIHEPGSEIGIIEQFWPSSVQHVKMIPSKEIDLLLSLKHEISKSPECLPETNLNDFASCFRSKFREKEINSQFFELILKIFFNSNIMFFNF